VLVAAQSSEGEVRVRDKASAASLAFVLVAPPTALTSSCVTSTSEDSPESMCRPTQCAVSPPSSFPPSRPASRSGVIAHDDYLPLSAHLELTYRCAQQNETCGKTTWCARPVHSCRPDLVVLVPPRSS